MKKASVNYDPCAHQVLKQMNDTMHEYQYQSQKPFTDREKEVFVYAWREALLYAVDELQTMHQMLYNYPQVTMDPMTAVNKLAFELIKDNALTPFISARQ